MVRAAELPSNLASPAVKKAVVGEALNKDALLRLDYPDHLWNEKEIKGVANVTRADVREFLQLAAEIPIKPEVQNMRFGTPTKRYWH